MSGGFDDKRKAEIEAMLSSNDFDGLTSLVNQCVEESMLLGTSKPILTCMIEYGARETEINQDLATKLCQDIMAKIARRATSFGEEAVRVREVLADDYEGRGMLMDAIKVLSSMPIESGLRSGSDLYKVSVWVRVSELALRIDDTVIAETYITKAWPVSKQIDDQPLKLRFSACFAEVLDVKRKFYDAGQRFFELSKHIDDQVPALQKAIVCVLLADAGPQRARLLDVLVKDERTQMLGDLYAVLSKVYFNRVLRPRDVEVIRPYLKPHHKTVVKGRTVFENAVMQHNIFSASQLYYNISLSELGTLLDIAPEQAERVASQMIAEDRLKATIDQANEMIVFSSDKSASIFQWDAQISAACNSVSAISDTIVRMHPEFAKHL